ncbi:hypothetical protein V6N11_007464 [Hibiscus sabdariffa]|uniref:Uncharacterized protein n=2 Tax=Hibiscus sabdariffa TaxID=183260 RepID=A0ABR2NS48_9ROSI
MPSLLNCVILLSCLMKSPLASTKVKTLKFVAKSDGTEEVEDNGIRRWSIEAKEKEMKAASKAALSRVRSLFVFAVDETSKSSFSRLPSGFKLMRVLDLETLQSMNSRMNCSRSMRVEACWTLAHEGTEARYDGRIRRYRDLDEVGQRNMRAGATRLSWLWFDRIEMTGDSM